MATILISFPGSSNHMFPVRLGIKTGDTRVRSVFPKSNALVAHFERRCATQDRIGIGYVPHVNNVSIHLIVRLSKRPREGFVNARNKSFLADFPVQNRLIKTVALTIVAPF